MTYNATKYQPYLLASGVIQPFLYPIVVTFVVTPAKPEQKLGAGPENSCHCRSSYPPDTLEANLEKVGL
jgi:hypothetical protein